ncbi:hypothetical protein LEP1GSC096_1986 [Leptospira interrogans serovar Hebdomadis str. R499]|nr:hypothetical protein LEP1GSC096_1986 [Leptospira interrogans serovar Hebdomadis str. R499]
MSIWENGDEKVKAAKRAVDALRLQAEGFFEKKRREKGELQNGNIHSNQCKKNVLQLKLNWKL